MNLVFGACAANKTLRGTTEEISKQHRKKQHGQNQRRTIFCPRVIKKENIKRK